MKTPPSIASLALISSTLFFATTSFGELARAGDPPAAPRSDPEVDVVEVGGAVRSLPRVTLVPADAGAVAETKELARLVAATGLFAATTLAPGASTAGLVVRVSSSADGEKRRLEAVTTDAKDRVHRRAVSYGASTRALDVARLADAVLADLSGERSHLSGTLLFVDAKTPGERRVRVMLGSGAPLRDASHEGVLARGADVGPGGVVHWAAAAPGEPLRIFAEGRAEPLAVKVPGYLQSVAFAPDGRAAVIAGDGDGGSLWVGFLEGTMKKRELGPGIALHPAFSSSGGLAYAAGPPTGPLAVYVDGKRVSGGGEWATAPSFCPESGKARIAYMVKGGDAWTTVIRELGGDAHVVGPGAHPACSPDGRTVAIARPRRGNDAGGVWLIGEDGIAAHRVHEGEVVDLRWAPGPSLPPEG